MKEDASMPTFVLMYLRVREHKIESSFFFGFIWENVSELVVDLNCLTENRCWIIYQEK